MSVDTGWFDLYANGGYDCAVTIPKDVGGRIGMVGTESARGHCDWTPAAVTPR
nr:hypothetical protein [Streptomyces sp. QL37]